MNLRAVANAVSTAVNPNVSATILHSVGYATGADFVQRPVYKTFYGVPVQLQALDGPELRQVESLNLEGTVKAAYINGDWSGVIRAAQKGGDVLLVAGQRWLIVKVLEAWPQWVKVVLQLQQPAP